MFGLEDVFRYLLVYWGLPIRLSREEMFSRAYHLDGVIILFGDCTPHLTPRHCTPPSVHSFVAGTVPPTQEITRSGAGNDE